MFLNKTYPCVFPNHIEYKSYTKLWDLSVFDDIDYWFVDVFGDISFVHVIPDDILSKVKSDDLTHLLVSCSHEADLWHIEHIYRDLIVNLDIPANKIILYSENKNALLKVEQVAKKYNADKINVYWSLIFEMGIKHQLQMNRVAFSTLNTLEKKEYHKKFLNFNRRWRVHRPLFVALLYSKNLLDKGYVSLASVTDDQLNWSIIFDTLTQTVSSDPELTDLLYSNKDQIINIPNLYLDTEDLSRNRPRLVEDDIAFSCTKELYENTYFSIASETYFFNSPGPFFTEKIFKPIAYQHPFILISGATNLRQLTELGYKTFHPFINEDYDSEPNDVNRLKMILAEVERLSNLSQAQLYEFIDNVKPIVTHNLKVLRSKSNRNHLRKIG